MITEPQVILNVLGTLIKKPELLDNTDLYQFSLYDFEDRVYKIIYSAVYNLYNKGITKIDIYSIDTYLQNYPKQHKVFNDNMDVVSDAIDFASEENFKYYYERLKKYSALRRLDDSGFDVKKYLMTEEENYDFKKIEEIQRNFDNKSIEEIFNELLATYSEIEEEYITNKKQEHIFAGKGLRDLKESLQDTPELGLPLLGDIYSTVCRGARITKFYLDSGVTGSGKSRRMAGNACHLAYEKTYDWITHSWKETGYNEKVVMITTEMQLDELQTLVLSYVSGVDEDKLLNGTYTFDENEIIDESIDMIENGGLILDRLADYDVKSLKSRIRKHVAQNNVKYVFFDYIHTTPSAMGQFGGYGLREDVVLGLVSAALKDLCNELNIFIYSGTQLNGRWEDAKVRNQNLIRGSKAIADKIDVGTITLPISEEEKEFCKKISSNLNVELPNMVTDVYKARRSKYTPPMRIWSYVDLGTCRIKNLYATDLLYNPKSVDIVEIEYQDQLAEKHKREPEENKDEKKEQKKIDKKEKKEEKKKEEYKQKFNFS